MQCLDFGHPTEPPCSHESSAITSRESSCKKVSRSPLRGCRSSITLVEYDPDSNLVRLVYWLAKLLQQGLLFVVKDRLHHLATPQTMMQKNILQCHLLISRPSFATCLFLLHLQIIPIGSNASGPFGGLPYQNSSIDGIVS